MCARFLWLIPLLALALPSEGRALGIFKRTPKPDPVEHVPALIKTLQSDPDERKRATAAEDLHEYDAKTFPEIIPALIAALQNDNSTSVRLKSAASIGKIRPITQPAGYALDQAVQKDPSIRVRAEVKIILVRWIIEGYKPGRPADKNRAETEEPPLAEPLPSKAAPSRAAPPVMSSPSATKPTATRPLLPFLPAKNVKPPKPADDGPALNPPK